MDLYIRQRVFAWGDKYDITDDQETPVFRVRARSSPSAQSCICTT